MGMFHVCLLVMFSCVLSVRSCTRDEGSSTEGSCISRATRGGKLTFPNGYCKLSNKRIVFILRPSTQRKFQNRWTSGIIFLRRRPNCEANGNMAVSCPPEEYRQLQCLARNKTENDCTTTRGTATTETVTQTSPSTVVKVTTGKHDHKTTIGTTENDHGQTSRTPTIETVNPTSRSTCIVDYTILTPDITGTWKLDVDTGSRIRGYSYLTVQWKINTEVCTPVNQTLEVVQRRSACNKTRKESDSKTPPLNPISMVETFRGLQPHAIYYLTLTVTCLGKSEKYCVSKPVPTAESVPTAPPENITAIKARDNYLIFKWKEPPCDQMNGKITNYDFIFKKNGYPIHNVTPRKFVVFNGMQRTDSYSFKVRANTKRGFGEYSELKRGYFKDLPPKSSFSSD